MTKIGFVADVHVANHRRWGGPTSGGVNQRGQDCVQTLRRAVIMAATEGCDAFVVLGDLFDAARPTPPLVAAVATALGSWAGQTTMAVYVILGNHDRQSQHELDHACASLAQVPWVSVITGPTLRRVGKDCELWLLPYQAGEAQEWITDGLAEIATKQALNEGRRRLACTHLGIWDDDTPPYLKAAKDAIGIGYAKWLCDTHKLSGFFAGNWHTYRIWAGGNTGTPVLIPGTLCPASFSDPPNSGVLVVYDSSMMSIGTRFVGSPVFDTWHYTDLLEGNTQWTKNLSRHFSREDASGYYIRVKVLPQDMDRARAKANDLRESYPRLVIDLQVDSRTGAELVRESARQAVALAEKGSFAEAYADLGAVQEPGTRDGVATRLRAYRQAVG